MIALDKAGARWTVTLNRPDKANSLSRAMLGDLDDILADAAGAGIAALVITGAGKVFSAGADLDEARAGLATDPVWESVSGRIASLDALTVAALNGTLAGGAFGMALACDLRLAVPGARFFYPVMKLGFLPQPSDPGRLVALVGPARAKLILMGGARLDAEDALAFGLVDRLVPPEDLRDAADALVADALTAAPAHRTAIKALCEGRVAPR
ncbi:enoyl-CoA hydratase/isomerase family protein [Rhodovulum euryhalinum]|uniref:Enoyl-CoA hydratase n=1 Tax=Rhodovulum euryhalinum TaxID=35805 RepID=A0A4R2L2J2_9RHOB|nr:enoyl-CoA hydratase/isomerase family protein [Rhodovulum euryhalinum]TCO73295.1 enoyl-CoA hydratase [Rhodovulum euryhalinum]